MRWANRKVSTVGVALLLLSACSSIADIKESIPYRGSFSSFRSFRVQSVANPALPDDESYRRYFSEQLSQSLRDLGLFQGGNGPELVIRYRILSVDLPSTAPGSLSPRQVGAILTLGTDFFEGKDQTRPLTSLHVSGNATLEHRPTSAGLLLSDLTELTEAAMRKAASRIAAYVKKHS